MSMQHIATPLCPTSSHLPLCCSDNGFGQVYAAQLCTLKHQNITVGSPLDVYATGTIVPWSSGYLL